MSAVTDGQAVTDRARTVWGAGDYADIGTRLVLLSELLCEAADVRSGERVLDVATGTGNAALAAARRFCETTGTDFVPALLERARARAEVEGLAVTFREGDAQALPFEDGSFDVVLSAIGAMFAPDQERTAGELLRVCRPGGRIAMANWTPEGFVGELFRVQGRYAPPPPPGARPAVEWGTGARLRELFGDEVELSTQRREFLLRFPSSRFMWDHFADRYGPTVTLLATLDAERREALAEDFVAVAERYNRADDGTLVLVQEYLEVVARRR